MKKQNHKAILYITHNSVKESSAETINTQRRKEIMVKLGYTVFQVYEYQSILNTFRKIIQKIHACQYIVIRIDGSGSLDKFSILKLLFPLKIFVWEIHGHPNESLFGQHGIRTRLTVRMQMTLRYVLSFFSRAHIFISKPLKVYSRGKIATKSSIIIENFITNKDIHLAKKIIKNAHKSTNKKSQFIIFWGGNQNYPWHATNLLMSVAKKIETINSTIQFVTIGNAPNSQKANNILYVPKSDRHTFLSIIDNADICIAIYKTTPNIPVYFSPMKLLDYLLMKKPVIISDIPSVRSHFKKNPAGILVDNSVSQIMRSIIRLKKSPSLRNTSIQNGQQLLTSIYSEKNASLKYRKILTTPFDTI